MNAKTITDSFLLKRGYVAYDVDEIKKKVGLDLTGLKRFSLEEMKEKIKGNGKLPLLSPLFFQQNKGQVKGAYEYIMQAVGYAVGFNARNFSAIVMKNVSSNKSDQERGTLRGNRITLNFKGAAGDKLVGKKQIDATINSFVGNKKEKWHKQIPGYDYLANENLYPGIRIIYEAKQERIKYILMLEPSADLKKVRISVDGIGKMYVDKNGNLIMNTQGGQIVQTRPKVYDLTPSGQNEIKGRFVIFGKKEYGFAVENHNPNLRLLIDPEIVFTTYFGGLGNEGMLGADDGAMDFIGRGFDIKIGQDGDIYVVGMTVSPDFPVTNASTINGSTDVFVMRVDPTLPTGQNLIYATFVGGSSSERGRSIEAMPDGSAYITGHSSSSDFPTSSGVVQSSRGGSGAYVAKLSPTGSFELGTYIGNARSNHPNSIVFNKSGNDTVGHLYIAGSTQGGAGSDSTTGSFQTRFAGGQFDGFIVRLNPNMSVYEYFTYLGGTGRDVVMDLDVVDGFAYVTGMTSSKDFPATEFVFQTQHTEDNNTNCSGTITNRECADAFVARLHPSGSSLIFSTYLGEPGSEDFARGIAVNNQGQAYVTGASKPLSGNNTNIFVAKLEAGGGNVLWKRLITGRGRDHGEELVVDQFGRAYVTGTISVDGLSTGLGANTFHGGSSDIFFARLTEDQGLVDFFTYLGGTGEDRGFAVDAAASSNENFCATIVGSTVSDNIQTINPIQGGESRRGGADLLIFSICNAPPDIRAENLSKFAPATVRRGESITYTITLVNEGDFSVPVTVSDNVPSTITVTGVQGAGCTRIGNSITCTFQAQPGASTIVVTGTVNPSANPNNCTTTSITNTVTVRVGTRNLIQTATTQILCPVPLCGNQRIDPGEECDGTPGCRSNCTQRRCGDGIVDPGEECDDGNSNNNDHCRDCSCFNVRFELCSRNDSCSCEPGYECKRAIAGVIYCSCFDGCFACIFCESYCGELLFEAEARCNPTD